MPVVTRDDNQANGAGASGTDGPRRSSLVQERSRRTRQELVNAVDQAQREMRTRYDLKDSKSAIELEEKIGGSFILRMPDGRVDVKGKVV